MTLRATLLSYRQRGRQISRNCWLFLWMVFLSNVGLSGIFALLYNLYLVALGHHEDFIGVLSFVQMAAIALGAIPASRLSERFGPRRVLLAGSLVVGMSTLGLCLATRPWMLALWNLSMGLGFALRIVPYTPYLVRNTTRAERTLIFSANSAAISLAGTIGSLLGGQLPTLAARLLGLGAADSIPAYRASLLVGAAIGLLAVLPMAFASESTPASEAAANGSESSAPAEDPPTPRRAVTILVGVTVLFSLAGACFMPFTNVYLSEVLGLQASAISLIFSSSSILAVIATILASDVADRYGKARTLSIVRASAAPLLVALALAPSVWLGTITVVVRGITDMAAWPLDNAFLADVIPLRRQARVTSYRSIAWNLTWALASFAAGQAIVRFGYQGVILLSAVVLFSGGLIYYSAFGRGQRKTVHAGGGL